jgi:phage tail-like protein
MVGNNNPLIYFDSLTGGDQKIETINYKVRDSQSGLVITKTMPGQTTYAPITLLRALDPDDEEMKKKFMDTVHGLVKKVRSNYTVQMFDGQGTVLVHWNLIHTIPTGISGFSFNSTTESSYTSFELTLQAESIEINFT